MYQVCQIRQDLTLINGSATASPETVLCKNHHRCMFQCQGDLHDAATKQAYQEDQKQVGCPNSSFGCFHPISFDIHGRRILLLPKKYSCHWGADQNPVPEPRSIGSIPWGNFFGRQTLTRTVQRVKVLLRCGSSKKNLPKLLPAAAAAAAAAAAPFPPAMHHTA